MPARAALVSLANSPPLESLILFTDQFTFCAHCHCGLRRRELEYARNFNTIIERRNPKGTLLVFSSIPGCGGACQGLLLQCEGGGGEVKEPYFH